MTIKKRLLALLLAVCLAAGLLPGSAMAAGFPFVDVKPGSWQYDAAQYVYNNSIMNGTGNRFNPNNPTIRAMLVQILYNLEGSPAVADGESFSDVHPGVYYEKAVKWASQTGLVTGVGKGRFVPDGPISRQQLALILYKYAQYKGYDTSKAASLRGFSDYGKISGYALDAMSWAYAEGLISGVGGNKINPAGNAIRVQVAAIFKQFMENVAKKPGKVTYTVTFNGNWAGAGTPQVVNVESGQMVAAPNAPSREGYRFEGWFTRAEGGEMFSFDTPVTASTTLYAHWAEETTPPGRHTVTFMLNYAGAGVHATATTVPGNMIGGTPADPSREGYTFLGWYTQAEGGALFSFDTPVTADLTLYAHWSEAKTHQVAFDLNYPNGSPGMLEPKNVPEGQPCPEPGFEPQCENYLFAGWYTEPVDGVLFNFSAPVTASLTLYAHWTYNGPNYAKPYQTSNRITLYDGTDPLNHFDMMGIEYSQGMVFSYGYNDESNASFSLEGKYEVMTFDVGHVDNGGRNTETLYFYIDGGSTPVMTLELAGHMSTEHIVLNVKNRTNLQVVRKGGGGYSYAMGNMLLLTADQAREENIVTPAIYDSSLVKATNLESGAVMPYQTTNRITLYDGTDPLNHFSMMGLEYSHGVRMSYGYNDESDMLFNLGGGFDMLSFKVGHVDNGGRNTETLYLYADDELVDTINLTCSMSTTTYALNTRDVNKLRIVRQGGGGYDYAIADMTAYTAGDLADAGITAPADHAYFEVNQTNLAAGPVLPYQISSRVTVYDGTDPVKNNFSMNGATFDQGVRFAYGYNDDSDINFNLGKGFTKISFIAGHVDGKATNEEHLYFYKDSDAAPFYTMTLTGSMMNTPVELDITGVNNLRVERKGGGGYDYAIANITVS